MIELVIEAIWFILPAWIANSAAVDVSGLPVLKHYSAPVDGGKSWRGKRLLGDGKTWRGFIAGTLAGAATGWLQMSYQTSASSYFQTWVSGTLTLPQASILLGFILGFGAMIGDMGASFLKRRMSLKRGALFPIVDQLDFIVAAFLFSWLIVPVNLDHLAIVVVITVPIHLFSNWFAYKIKLKEVWW